MLDAGSSVKLSYFIKKIGGRRSVQFQSPIPQEYLINYRVQAHIGEISDVNPVGSEFIWVRGSGFRIRDIELREKQSLTNIFFPTGNYIFQV